MVERSISVLRLAGAKALRIEFPRLSTQDSRDDAIVTLTFAEGTELFEKLGSELAPSSPQRAIEEVREILGSRENESVTDAAKRVRDTASGFDSVAVVGPLDALQIVQQDRDEWKRRTRVAESTTKLYADDRDALADRLELVQAELNALRVLEKAARARFEAWTRETYVGLETAFKALDDYRAKAETT